MNYYAFHIGDYIADTAHLTNEEDLCYRRAIDLYMMQEGPLGDGLADAKRTLSRRLRVDEQTLENVLEEFFTLTENGYEHARCNAEIAKYQAKSDKAKQAGKLGGTRKASKRLANAKRTPSERLANQEPRTRNQEPRTRNQIKEESPSSSLKDMISKPEIDDDDHYARFLRNDAKLQAEIREAEGQPPTAEEIAELEDVL
jgi:uncharacterized protein YdaU (DUF1376 family)